MSVVKQLAMGIVAEDNKAVARITEVTAEIHQRPEAERRNTLNAQLFDLHVAAAVLQECVKAPEVISESDVCLFASDILVRAAIVVDSCIVAPEEKQQHLAEMLTRERSFDAMNVRTADDLDKFEDKRLASGTFDDDATGLKDVIKTINEIEV